MLSRWDEEIEIKVFPAFKFLLGFKEKEKDSAK
jgi:hypothetical protein